MKTIEIKFENSSIFGYISSLNEHNFKNYLQEHLENDVIENLENWMTNKNLLEFCLLKHIFVDEMDRNKRIGSKLMEKFIAQSQGLPIILICDNLESQLPGFNLQSWYENLGFEHSGFKTLSGPILIRF